MTWKQLQEERKVWSQIAAGEEDYPESFVYFKLIGKFGALVTAHVEGNLEKKKQACALVMIFLAEYFSCRGWSLEEEWEFSIVVSAAKGGAINDMIKALAGKNWRWFIGLLNNHANGWDFDLEHETFQCWEMIKQDSWWLRGSRYD